MLTQFCTATLEEIEKFTEFAKILKETFPDWNGKLLTPETSVRLVLGVVDRWERKDSERSSRTGGTRSGFGGKNRVEAAME